MISTAREGPAPRSVGLHEFQAYGIGGSYACMAKAFRAVYLIGRFEDVLIPNNDKALLADVI